MARENKQTITLDAANYSETVSEVRWQYTASRPQIDSELTAPGVDRFFDRLTVRNAGTLIQLELAASAGGTDVANEDLSAAFERLGSLKITVGSNVLTVNLAGLDPTDPYAWTPSNSDEIVAWVTAVLALSGNQSGTLVIRDYPDEHEQEIALASSFYSETPQLVEWNFTAGNRLQVDDGLTPGNASRYLSRLQLSFGGTSAGRVRFDFEDSLSGGDTTSDLTTLFEDRGSIKVVSGSDSLIVNMARVDTTEPYSFVAENSAEVIAFAQAVQARSGNQSATVTLRDYPEPGTASQEIALPASIYEIGTDTVVWRFANGSLPAIDDDLTASSNPTRLFRQVNVQYTGVGRGTVMFDLSASQTVHATGQNLSGTFAVAGSLKLESGGDTVIMDLAAGDFTDIYSWVPANAAEVITWATAVAGRTGDQAATLTIRDWMYPGVWTNEGRVTLRDANGRLKVYDSHGRIA